MRGARVCWDGVLCGQTFPPLRIHRALRRARQRGEDAVELVLHEHHPSAEQPARLR